MGLFRKKKKNTEITISDGVVLKQPLQMEASSWLKNCMVKSLLVFSVVFGSLGCFLSSFDLQYNVLFTALILAGAAFFFTTIYYRGWIMDVAYIAFFILFLFLVRGFQTYINSGYYLIINRILKTVEDYFDLPGMQYYEIADVNEAMAVSIVVIFIGTVMMIVANVIVSRTMNVWLLLLLTGGLWLVPLYFRLEADAVYMILVIVGYISVWAIRSSGAYGMDREHREYKWKDRKGKKLRIWYMQDAKTMLQGMAACLVVVLLLYGITAVAGNKSTFQTRYRQNPYKEESETMLQEMSSRGFSFFNRYAATGGISGGQLGGVSSVMPDYQTDLVVTFTPYSYDPVYLKAFTGTDYISEDSKWDTIASARLLSSQLEPSAEEIRGYMSHSFGSETEQFGTDLEAEQLQAAYADESLGGRGYMKIRNQGAAMTGMYPYAYAPYYVPEQYSDTTGIAGEVSGSTGDVRWGNEDLLYENGDILTGTLPLNNTALYEYYPLLDTDVWDETRLDGMDETTKENLQNLHTQAEEMYLEVPDACYDAVKTASREAGITDTDSPEIIVQKVKDYFTNEFQYTTRPGMTPRNQDFITWFLQQKKGYCAHFASAATMIYRYNGIPARYIEGYVITYDDIINGELNEEYRYEDFYQGESLLGKTGVVDVEVTDARAHAWVEVFSDSFGWVEEEVTTAAVEPEEAQDSFWDVFGRDGTGNDANGGNGFGIDTMDWNLDDIRGIWIALLAVLAGLGLYSAGRKGYVAWKRYQTWHTPDLNENIVAYYAVISGKMRKKDPAYAECPTYRRQLAYMAEHMQDWKWDADMLADMLERANYSREGLPDFDAKRVMLELEDIEKKVQKWKYSRK